MKIKNPSTQSPVSIVAAKKNGNNLRFIKKNGQTIFASLFSVSQTLDGVTSDAPSTVALGGGLVVTFTPGQGMALLPSTVRVTMGGADITDTAFDFGTKKVTLANVTGDVTIEAIGAEVDAEVEYLQSDGNAYINTGIKIANTVTFDISMHVPVGLSRLFGGRVNGTSGNLMVFKNTNTTIGQKCYRWFYGGSNFNGPSVSDTTPAEDHTFSNTASSRILVMDGETSITASARTFSTSVNFGLLGVNLNGTWYASGDGTRCYKAKMYSSGTLVRDFIPVKKDNIGYLYDKVSGQLFGNAGSGAFSYGNDK